MLDNVAPVPSGNIQANATPEVSPQKDLPMLDPKNPSAVTVTIAGCGGCGMNLARPFLTSKQATVRYFDTSMTNSRSGESVNIVTNGSGSGSNRSENAREIERAISQLPDHEMGVDATGLNDVAIVIFSMPGGSGSVIGPMLVREFTRREKRVIAVVVADTSSLVGAKDTLNTLKTLTAICNNNDLYLPVVLLSNNQAGGRDAANEASAKIVTDLLDILTQPVYEVDRNDRLNWINPTKIVNAKSGLKIITVQSDKKIDTKVALGTESSEMVDSLLILQSAGTEEPSNLPPARLKKTGFYYDTQRTIVGRVSSDISSIDAVITSVERMQQQDVSQKHHAIDRLASSGQDDLIL